VKDEAEAVRYYKLTVDQNDTNAQYDYTVCLDGGRGVVKDEAEAVGYFKLTTDQNHISAQFHYAVCLEDGRGVAKNEVKLFDIADLLPIRMIHHHKIAVPFSFRPGDAL
jgi:TPR repeat protein